MEREEERNLVVGLAQERKRKRGKDQNHQIKIMIQLTRDNTLNNNRKILVMINVETKEIVML